MRIFVLGSFVQACCWKLPRLPQAGESLAASALHIELGGKGLNVAICARRLGSQVDIALGLGEDTAAQEVLALLDGEEVGREHAYALAQRSGHGGGFIAADGHNAVAVYLGPNQLLQAHHMHLASRAIASADMVYAQFETAMPAILAAFQQAKSAASMTVLNPSPWQAIPADVLACTDIIIVNRHEACALLQLDEAALPLQILPLRERLVRAAANWFARWDGHCLVVTLGALGSLALLPDGNSEYCPAHAIAVVDSLGAGDAFAAGFCVSYLSGESLATALCYANACGAWVTSHADVLEALPDIADIAGFMRDGAAVTLPA